MTDVSVGTTRVTGTLSDASVIAAYSPVNPEVIENPFPSYQALRQACPVHRTDQMGLPLYTLSRHSDVLGVLRDHQRWSNRDGPGVGYATQGVGDMQHDDEPEHQRRRRLALEWFLPSAVRRLEPELRQLSESLVESLLPLRRADLYEQFALPMPVTSFCSLLGVTLSDREQFVHWADEITAGMAYPERAQSARDALSQFTAGEVERRQSLAAEGGQLPEGLLSHLATAPWQEDGSPMPVIEVVGMVNQLLIAGHETTTSLITNCMWRLLEDRSRLWELVVADPSLIPATVEESLRYDPPVLGLCRTNNEPVMVHEEQLPERTKLMVLFASANRDETIFEDPDTFRLDRPQGVAGQHLAFGWGVHHCLGSRLARLSGKVAIETLASRLPDIRLDGPTARVPSPFLWGRKLLPVAW